MSPALIAAAVRLADALSAENAALTALDIPRAALLLAEKAAAADGFLAARALAAPTREAPAPALAVQDLATQGPAAHPNVALAARLCALAEENRRLLERALQVQRRVMGLIARAAPAASPGPGYGRTGRPARAGGPQALMSRA